MIFKPLPLPGLFAVDPLQGRNPSHSGNGGADEAFILGRFEHLVVDHCATAFLAPVHHVIERNCAGEGGHYIHLTLLPCVWLCSSARVPPSADSTTGFAAERVLQSPA
jgi:hypothetical protein